MTFQANKSKIQLQLGERIRFFRKRNGISQEELAFQSGLDRTYLGGIERGERNPSLLNIEKIANALGIRIKDLFDNE
jgi:transcriptional regulator with XRE-family HTH domain